MKKLLSQSGVVHTLPLLVIVAAVGVISFLLISSTFPLGGFFGLINPKNTSHAAPSLGTWVNVTPAGMDLVNGGCGNFGTQSVGADPARPSDLYAEVNCQGIWKSTNYGQTWVGPINTGTNGATAGDCAGGISVARGSGSNPAILYESCIRGAGNGFWRSVDAGVSWTRFNVGLVSGREDYYAPDVDPYDSNHLIMAGHEMNSLAQSTDGGQTWTNITLNSGMNQNGGTASFFFINTGSAATTRNTWLWMAQGSGGGVGTWRTTNGGSSWTRVDNNEKPHGEGQIYQPDTNGVVYMAGIYGSNGWGVSRSTNYGQTWSHVGNTGNQAVVFGTPNNVYSMYAWACGSCTVAPNFQAAQQPGASGWIDVPTPSNMAMGAAQTAVVNNGSQYIIVSANWQSGLWRYAEPASGATPPPSINPTPTPSAAPSATPGNPTAISGLHVTGTQIRNSQNQVVKLVGVNKSGTEYNCNSGGAIFDGPIDQASVQAMVNWRINIVRIPLNEICWLGINGVPAATSGANYRNAIVSYVNLLNQNGIAAIMDLQWNAPGTGQATALLAMPDQDHAPAFWTSVANTFKTNQSVIFDLFNEPFPDNNSGSTAAWTCLRDGGTCPGFSFTAVGMQSLVNTIRATGATNVIMSPGVQFSDNLSQWLTYKPTDSQNNLVASWHTYQGQVCSSTSCYDSQIAPVMAQVPLIAGEIGENDCQHTYIDPLMNWLDSHGGHYLGWAWNTYDCSSFPSLINNFNGTPTNFGIGFQSHLLGLPTATPGPSTTPDPTATPSGKVGDLDNDGDVDIFDYSTLVTNFGQTGTNILGDIDHDGDVDIFDYSALVTNFGK